MDDEGKSLACLSYFGCKRRSWIGNSDQKYLYDHNSFTEMSTGLGLSALPRDKAWIICRNYLQGAWTNLDKHEMILKQVTWVRHSNDYIF